MKAVATFLLVLCCLAVNRAAAWRCDEGPRLTNVKQVDAGQGYVVAVDRYGRPFFLNGPSWYYLRTTRVKHLTVGKAGLWGCTTANRVIKYVAGNFQQSSGLFMQQVDAGADHLVGVQYRTNRGYCAQSNIATLYRGGSLSWTYVRPSLRHMSCGPLGCWAIDSRYNVLAARYTYSTNCRMTGWLYVSGIRAKMIEVGSDGRVFALTTSGLVYERYGVNSRYRHGRSWIKRPMCMSVTSLSYDLGHLWAATPSGLLLKCRG